MRRDARARVGWAAVLLMWIPMSASGASVATQAPGSVRIFLGSATALPEVDSDRAEPTRTAGDDDAAFYGIGGFGAAWRSGRVDAFADVSGGWAFDDRGGNFASGLLHLSVWTAPAQSIGVGWVSEAYAFRVQEPVVHRTRTLHLGPAVRVPVGRARLTVAGETGWGETRVERSRGDVTRRIDAELRQSGITAEIVTSTEPVSFSGEVGYWDSDEGPFRNAEMAATAGGTRFAVRGSVAYWDSPLGEEWVGEVSLVIPFGGRWSLATSAGRAGPDPRTLVESGSQGVAVLSMRLVEWGGGARLPYRLDRSTEGVIVTFALERSGAERVEILGDFTGWQPTVMVPRGSRWSIEIPVSPGTYHYGFRVDGEWYVPIGLPGNVPDEWGQTNATLVVPEEREAGR